MIKFFTRKATKQEVNYFLFYIFGLLSGSIIGISCGISIVLGK